MVTTPLSPPPRFDEGDYALLRVRVARSNSEQAFVTFTSMQGQYSIRVPVEELRANENTEGWSIPL